MLVNSDGWTLVGIFKLIFSQDFEAEAWSRFWSWNLINLWHDSKAITCKSNQSLQCMQYYCNSIATTWCNTSSWSAANGMVALDISVVAARLATVSVPGHNSWGWRCSPRAVQCWTPCSAYHHCGEGSKTSTLPSTRCFLSRPSPPSSSAAPVLPSPLASIRECSQAPPTLLPLPWLGESL